MKTFLLVTFLISLPALACKDFSGNYQALDLPWPTMLVVKIEQKNCLDYNITINYDNYRVKADGIPYPELFNSQNRTRYEGENLVIGLLTDWRANEPDVKKCQEILKPDGSCAYSEIILEKQGDDLVITRNGNRWYCDDDKNCVHVPLVYHLKLAE